MKTETKVVWNQKDIEELLERELGREGWRLATPEGGGVVGFKWVVEGMGNAKEPTITVRAIAERIPSDEFSGTSYTSTYTGPGGNVKVQEIPAMGPVHVPTPLSIAPIRETPPRSRPVLTNEELEELRKLLPEPQYADQTLSSKSIVHDLLPGESKKRPD
jgi:hypothetical protein